MLLAELLASVRGGAGGTSISASSGPASPPAPAIPTSLPLMTEREKHTWYHVIKQVVVRIASSESALLSRVGKVGGGSWYEGVKRTGVQMMSDDQSGGNVVFMNHLMLSRRPEGDKGVSTSMLYVVN